MPRAELIKKVHKIKTFIKILVPALILAFWLALPSERITPEMELKMGEFGARTSSLRAHWPQIHILLVGTSRLKLITPQTLNRYLENSGCPALKVHVFSVPGLSLSELNYVLTTMPKTSKASLIIFEDLQPPIRPLLLDLTSPRKRYLASLHNTVLRMNEIWSYQESYDHKIYRSVFALIGMIAHYFPDATFTSPSDKSGEAPKPEKLDNTDQPALPSAFIQLLKEQENHEPLSASPPPSSRIQLFQQTLDLIAQQADQTLFMLPPNPERLAENTALAGALRSQIPNLPVLNMNDPIKFPEFWNPSLWKDNNHLNPDGTLLLSRQLAQTICRDFASAPEQP